MFVYSHFRGGDTDTGPVPPPDFTPEDQQPLSRSRSSDITVPVALTIPPGGCGIDTPSIYLK
jgi:hypothetical protein